MPDIETILTHCLAILSKEYAIEEVDYLPDGDQRRKANVPVWKLTITAETFGKNSDVNVFMAFPREFPYVMPWMIVPDSRFCYLPHISVKTRKLCLYEDGVVYDTTNIYGLIKDNIVKTRRWIELYSNQDNTEEYAKEIDSYWSEKYEDEAELEPHWIYLGNIPEHTCELRGFTYHVDYIAKDDKYFDQCIVCGLDESEDILKNIKIRYKASKVPVLFIKSLHIPATPPYSLTGSKFLECIVDDEDKIVCKKFLQKNHKGHILFPLGLEYMMGGVTVPNLNLYRKGFRPGTLNAIDVLTKLEYKNKFLSRIKSNIYEEKRIAERTAGAFMKQHKFLIIGLGSVGSNLCYYLNGYNNASFTLIDPDNLTIDNLGRHLLGFNYVDQRKVHAVADFLTLYRPDRKVTPIDKQIEEISFDNLNEASSIFLCTGDIMSEKWFLDKVLAKEIQIPSFIIWLEPYGISGLIIYVNPDEEETIKRLRTALDDNFLEYCLIDKSEYEEGVKLIHRDAGCNGQYALYSANDVTLLLSGLFFHIDRLINKTEETQIYQWVGNLEIAEQKGIKLVERAGGLSKNQLLRLPL
jgi:molybdopterin/thiamine biosynthesis adenylyltransferase